MKLAEQHNLSVYVTNQVMANPAMMFGDPTTPIGGNIVGHASTYRVYLRRGKQGSRVAKLIDSPNRLTVSATKADNQANVNDS